MLSVVMLFFGVLVAWLFMEVEYARIVSPDNQYQAIVTYRVMEMFGSFFPGQSGDKAGFIRITGMDGKNYGKIRVPMVWMSQELEWTDGGARLKLVGDWDFAKQEYRYWNESQTEQIVKRAR